MSREGPSALLRIGVLCALCAYAGATCAGGTDESFPGNYLNAGVCALCPAGSRCPAGRNTAELCPAGEYQPNIGNEVCIACAAGYHQPDTGQTACIQCLPGKYQPNIGNTVCIDCPRDHFCFGPGNTTYAQCPEGALAEPGQTACVACSDPEYWLDGGACTRKQVCNSSTYEPPVPPGSKNLADRDCRPVTDCTPTWDTNTMCVTGGGDWKCPFWTKYITRRNNATHDLVCQDHASCPPDRYVYRRAKVDNEYFLTQAQECRPYAPCDDTLEYIILDPTVNFDIHGNTLPQPLQNQDYVCGKITDCVALGRYTKRGPKRDFPNARDAECADYTPCDEIFEYVYLRGNSTHDNVCRPRTVCNALRVDQYEIRSAVDSQDWREPGNDTLCGNQTRCGPGFYPNATGGVTGNTECAPCEIGYYGLGDNTNCVICPAGSFTDRKGSPECRPCQSCTEGNEGNVTVAVGCLPNEGPCVLGYQRLCSPFNDSVCMQCPTETHEFRESNRLCRACGTGYHLNNATEAAEQGATCRACTPNFYCPSSLHHEICQDLRMFRNGSGMLRTVPSSDAAAVFATSCTCSSSGGFEGRPTGQLGCTPCANGTFSNPGNSSCHPCPEGSYAHTYRTTDLYRCPEIGVTPPVVFDATDPWPAVQRPSDCDITVGASQCTPCPTGHTRVTGASSEADCSLCPVEHYMSGGSCVPCRAPCASDNTEYESRACTDTTNRGCSECDLTGSQCVTGTFTEYVTRQCNPATGRACAPCPAPPANAYKVQPQVRPRSPGECSWACSEGYFQRDGEAKCTACAVYNSTTCPPGRTHSECGDKRDAACSAPCQESIRPILNSEWVLAAWNATSGPRSLVRAVQGSSAPNAGCMWDCVSGYRAIYTIGGQPHCVSERVPV